MQVKKYFNRLFLLLLLTAALAPLSAQSVEENPDFSRLLFTDYQGYTFHASSTLESGSYPYLGTYGMQVLFDGEEYSGWSEGAAGDGTGEVLWLEIRAGSDTLLLKNGFGRSESLFLKNNRVKALQLSLYCGYLPAGAVSEYGPLYVMSPSGQNQTIQLKDRRSLQEHALDFDYERAGQECSRAESGFAAYAEDEDLPPMIEKRVFILRMEISEVYRGSSWNDTCLTELRCFDSENFSAAEIESAEGALRYRNSAGQWRFLYADRELLYDPYLMSPDGNWCVAFAAPRKSEARVETGYALFHLPYPELHEHAGFDAAVGTGKIPVEFDTRNGAPSLEFDDGSGIILE